MELIPARYRGIYLALFGIFALFGISMTVIGASLPKILTEFGWDYATAGAVIAAGSVAYFLSSMAAGAALRRFGPKRAVLGGLLSCVVGASFFAASPSPFPNLLLNALIGGGQGFIEIVVNWSVLRMDEKGSGRAMNLMHGSFAVGAVVGPITAGILIAAGLRWALLYRAIAVVFVLLALAVALLPFSRLGREENGQKQGNKVSTLSRNPVYWLGFVTLLVYVGAELGVSTWVGEFFVKVFLADPALGSFMVSLFWIGLLAGRFGAPAFYRGKQQILLVGSSILLALSVVSLALLGLVQTGPSASIAAAVALVFLSGLGCSVVYPVAVSLVGASFPQSQSGAVSFAVAGGGLGLFVFPYLMAWISQTWGLRAGFLSYAVVAAATAVSCIALAGAFDRMRQKRGA
jgi:fucose permease